MTCEEYSMFSEAVIVLGLSVSYTDKGVLLKGISFNIVSRHYHKCPSVN